MLCEAEDHQEQSRHHQLQHHQQAKDDEGEMEDDGGDCQRCSRLLPSTDHTVNVLTVTDSNDVASQKFVGAYSTARAVT